MNHRLAIFLCASMLPALAFADRYPHTASDGLFIGARLEPGAALAVAYDLDIYLTGDRLLSLGPAVTLSFLGDEGVDRGRRQDFLFAVDALRFKVGLLSQGEWRPYVFVGGGFHYALQPEQRFGPVTVALPGGGTATGDIVFPRHEAFGGLLSAGVGIDGYLIENFAFTMALTSHIRLSDDERVPIVWGEALVGIRFGL